MLILHVLTNDPLPWPLTCWQSLLIWDLPEGVRSPFSYVCMPQGTGAASTTFPYGIFCDQGQDLLCSFADLRQSVGKYVHRKGWDYP